MAFQLRQLNYLCVLADTGNYHAAAEKLFVTQPTLSLAIKKLESSLGVRLFDRKLNGITPTPEGKIIISYAKRILALNQEMEWDLKKLQQAARPEFRIGTYQILYPLIMPKVLTQFQQSYPDMRISSLHNHYLGLEEALLKHALDLILCITDKENKSFDTIPLRKVHTLAALPPDHPACQKATIFPELAYPYLDIREVNGERANFQYDHQQIRWQEDKLVKQYGFRPGEIRENDSIDLAVQLASEGLGIAFTMECYMKALHVKKPIRFFIVGDLADCPWLTICTQQGRIRDPIIQTLIGLLKEQVEEL